MGQYWKLINIDRRQGLRLGAAKLGESLFWDDPNRIIWMLAMPRKPKPYQRSPERGHSKDTRDLGALNLPFDILLLIFQQFDYDNIVDAVYLALTNSFLRAIGQNHIYDVMFPFFCPWYLERVICVGDYLKGNDLPPDILKEDEKAELEGDLPHDDESGEHGARLYNANDTWFNDSAAQSFWREKFMNRNRKTPRMSRAERAEFDALAEPDFSWDGRPETEWILCNWTRAEYVRVSGVAALTDSPCKGPWTNKCLGLGHVLLTQICWSSDPSASMYYQGPITRGAWAGHYFAITTVDQLTEHPEFKAKKDWTDVTEKVTKQVLEIWRADWPEGLAKHLKPEDQPGVSDGTASHTEEEDVEDWKTT
ncbi:hypothetical protein DAEQUDRAFT_813725 [Daedalea quercina L-15889]|uniref:F-box domain-containing protein n=1 Tax=Daedalea quercina L-15889 TaxID=1314783 RepID=A0A165MVQ6_9APHY|nr:hypothetical protein DAEQUDRAFT_813725 [Daedalea quercina L-15889]